MKRAIALLVLLAHCASCGAQELGRLFFSPAERDALDARRSEKSGHAPAVAPAPARVDGYVLRSGGRPTFWVDGRMDRSHVQAETGGPQNHAAVRDVSGDGRVRVQR